MISILYLGKILEFDFMYTAIVSFLISYFVSAILSMYLIKKFYKSKFWNYELFRDMIVAGFIIYIINYLLSGISDLLHFILQVNIYFVLGLLYMIKVKRGWMAELRELLYER